MIKRTLTKRIRLLRNCACLPVGRSKKSMTHGNMLPKWLQRKSVWSRFRICRISYHLNHSDHHRIEFRRKFHQVKFTEFLIGRVISFEDNVELIFSNLSAAAAFFPCPPPHSPWMAGGPARHRTALERQAGLPANARPKPGRRGWLFALLQKVTKIFK